ncbi:aromatic acid exporter family protein [Bacillus sp. B15-48]|uniref:FUSC family protein n=1 Tax=Bacillus sp. B15-48 TaxID=1548601 RepID=UPI00193FD596|nr:aromatic acid exporter family protein [Bacillus sp. B15-48]MBM4765086.1 aromatic acid exporter family protein [Bacillus sp. B15-48]
MKFGARILKTGIAIILSLFLAQLLELPSPVFAGIAAIFAVQPTIYRSYLTVIEQIQGNIIGAIIAVLFVLTLGNNFFIIGLAAILVIAINLKLKLENTISLSLVMLIAIMVTPGDDFFEFALLRFTTIIIGVIAAFIVNLVFFPPKYEKKLYQKNAFLNEEISKWIRISTRHASEHQLLKEDIEKLGEGMIKLENLFIMYEEERNYFKKHSLAKSRKLVVYRQMITTNKAALDTLKRLHRYENETHQMPEGFQEAIQEHLDCIINLHEQVMLKYIGKINPEVTIIEGHDCFNKKELLELFLVHQNRITHADDQIQYHMIQLVAVIMEYGEQLEHLDRLISSFQSYHKDDKHIYVDSTIED